MIRFQKCKRPGCSQALAVTSEILKTRSPRPETYAWSLSKCANTNSATDKRHSL